MKQFILRNTVDLAFFIIFAFGVSATLIASFWHIGLFFGFAIGAMLSLLSIKLNVFISNFLSQKIGSKKAIQLIYIKNAVFFLLIILTIYVVILINENYLHKHNLVLNNWNYVNKPINLIALFVGVSLALPTYALETLLKSKLHRRWNG
ncbi:hypothetical protein [Mycoplasmopsis columboralis]|uniref:Uncharacterized protein n=1 Tax=Mycoplasmopsis columboralis TaxID=171282 RepID=A0A449B7J4_9BACT|nr:hypothetical protein [Mycoplasmopsis columboralis]VEU76550.1 Uncharacterised protein [Mycoplasmopsis columboralis]